MSSLTRKAWIAAAEDRYGSNAMKWRFRCPICKVETAVEEWKNAGASEGAVAFSCIGRFLPDAPASDFASRPGANGKKQPCNYTGGGFFKLNPVKVEDEQGREHLMFDFADRPLVSSDVAA